MLLWDGVVMSTGWTHLTCGCRFSLPEEDNGTLVYEPCKLSCEHYVWFMHQVEEAGKPVTLVEDFDVNST